MFLISCGREFHSLGAATENVVSMSPNIASDNRQIRQMKALAIIFFMELESERTKQKSARYYLVILTHLDSRVVPGCAGLCRVVVEIL